uniref:GOLGA2L5 domain-containing protein n=1 Tax=Macrostomum lignano TaxID=282301 RepID=A0A1I8JKD4_9PLAT
DDEHALIAAFAGTLRQRQNAAATTVSAAAAAAVASSSPMLPQSPQPYLPHQQQQQQHFSLPPDRTEQMKELEAENKRLQAEYERLKSDTSAQRQRQQQHLQVASPLTPVRSLAAAAPPPPATAAAAAAAAEARLLRAHKGRLEARWPCWKITTGSWRASCPDSADCLLSPVRVLLHRPSITPCCISISSRSRSHL